MSDNSDWTKALMPGFSYTFVQSAMLFLTYGMKYSMPWWVTWFPSVVAGAFLSVIGMIFFTIMVISVFKD